MTDQKSTFGANLRWIKYSSFIAASCNAIAVSSNSSFPVLEKRREGTVSKKKAKLVPAGMSLRCTHTLNTWSAVLRTINERGSDYRGDVKSVVRAQSGPKLTVLYTLLNRLG